MSHVFITKDSPIYHLLQVKTKIEQKKKKSRYAMVKSNKNNTNNHGGARSNSGRRPMNQTWGNPADRASNQRGIESFFSSTTHTTAQRESSPATPVTRQTSQPPSQRQSSSSTIRQASQDHSTATQSSDTRPVFGPPPPPAPPTFGNLPNFDSDNTFIDSEVYHPGKKISNCDLLKQQRKDIMDPAKKYYEKAYNNIQNNGQCWDLPPTVLKKPQYKIQERWKDFFKLKIFNWIPEAMIHKDWKPRCPHCSKKLSKWGKACPPRLVFGQNENYWLNSPNKYFCQDCSNSQQHLPKAERKTVTFTATSDAIMSQIGDSNPEIIDLFPCHLSKKNAIDKQLLDLVIHNAVKGVGPYATAEMLISWHQLEWQKKENLWARHIIQQLIQPSALDPLPRNRSDIEKCPEYFSPGIGGCTPSGKYLVEIFCLVVKRMRRYYDSECIKRARSSLIIAIDASYKVPKWMMKWVRGGDRIYEALHSGTNEYNEIIMQRFSTSDNHLELGYVLQLLKDLGLNPHIAFTDDPGRDESLLLRTFPTLDNGSGENEILPEDLVEVTSTKQIHYVFKLQDVLDTLSRFRDDLDTAIKNTAQITVKVAFDAEWPMYITGDQNNRKMRKGDINILQLGSNVCDYTVIVELYNFIHTEQAMISIGQKLRAIFMLKVSCFTGCKQKNDYTLLSQQYPMFNLPQDILHLMDDVSIMAINRGLTTRGKERTSLQALCRGQKQYLRKPEQIRVGTVFASTRGMLNSEALKYCQLDVEAPLTLHSIYSGYPDLTKRLTSKTPSVGDKVDIMPASAKNMNPIAQGVIKQVEGLWATNGHKISKTQVLVEVHKVFNGKGILHYPHTNTKRKVCGCGRSSHSGSIKKKCDFYMYSQLGKPKFLVVELMSRLRATSDMIKYPACIYEGDSAAVVSEATSTVEVALQADEENQDESNTGAADEVVVEDDSDDECIDDDHIEDGIPREAMDIFFADDVVNLCDDDDDDITHGDVDATPQQIQHATDTNLNQMLQRLIEEADSLSGTQMSGFTFNEDVESNLQPDELPKRSYEKRVLADIFHLMDRAKLPMHHEYKALFFRSLRAAMFVMCKADVDDVKEVLQSKGESWDSKMAFDFGYITQRVRRIVPPPQVLYNRLKAVFDFFKDKVDSKKNTILFNKRNRERFESMLELVKKGYATDPTNLGMYVPKTDNYGRQMVDEDGLVLYRSLRGTSNLESLHQYLTTSFGHTIAGPYYCDSLLTVLRHMYNWRMSKKNRPGFPNLMHYNGLMIDQINRSYETIYGVSKYREWSTYNENLTTESPYGIVSVESPLTSSIKRTDEDDVAISKNPRLGYLCERQGTPYPCLPIRGVNERKLVYKKLKDMVASNESLTSETALERLTKDWNENEVSIQSKIYPKLPCHFARYIKKWRRNQDRRDAEISSGANRLSEVLEHIPENEPLRNFLPSALNDASLQDSNNPMETEPANSSPATDNAIVEPPNPGLNILSNVSETQQPMVQEETPQEPARKRRRKRCQGYNKIPCPEPDTCDGVRVKANCVLLTGGDKSKEVKRSCAQPSQRRCRVCGVLGCPGGRNQSRCTGGTNNT